MTKVYGHERDTLIDNLVGKLEFYGHQKVKAATFNGRIVTVTTDYDEHTDPFTDHEDMGRISEGYRDPNTGYNRRPDDFDGQACKLDTRQGPVWWQPPGKDYAPDDQTREQIRMRAQEYLHEQWSYIIISVRVGNAVASLGGLETDSGDYFKEVIGELLDEVLADDASNVCPCCKQPLPTKEIA